MNKVLLPTKARYYTNSKRETSFVTSFATSFVTSRARATCARLAAMSRDTEKRKTGRQPPMPRRASTRVHARHRVALLIIIAPVSGVIATVSLGRHCAWLRPSEASLRAVAPLTKNIIARDTLSCANAFPASAAAHATAMPHIRSSDLINDRLCSELMRDGRPFFLKTFVLNSTFKR